MLYLWTSNVIYTAITKGGKLQVQYYLEYGLQCFYLFMLAIQK